MINNSHRSGSITSTDDKVGTPNVVTRDRSGKVSDVEVKEKPRSYGATQCERIAVVNGKLRIVKC